MESTLLPSLPGPAGYSSSGFYYFLFYLHTTAHQFSCNFSKCQVCIFLQVLSAISLTDFFTSLSSTQKSFHFTYLPLITSDLKLCRIISLSTPLFYLIFYSTFHSLKLLCIYFIMASLPTPVCYLHKSTEFICCFQRLLSSPDQSLDRNRRCSANICNGRGWWGVEKEGVISSRLSFSVSLSWNDFFYSHIIFIYLSFFILSLFIIYFCAYGKYFLLKFHLLKFTFVFFFDYPKYIVS